MSVVAESKAILLFVPWNLGLSVSSLLVCVIKELDYQVRSIITLVSPALNLFPSSLNFKIYSPSKYGSSAVVVLPANASIKIGTELENVPLPSVFEENVLHKPDHHE